MSRRAYRIVWASAAKRALQRLPEKAAFAVIEFATSSLAENPERVGKTLRFELEGKRSARRGGYRVVYRSDGKRHRVVVEFIQHRSDVYRRR